MKHDGNLTTPTFSHPCHDFVQCRSIRSIQRGNCLCRLFRPSQWRLCSTDMQAESVGDVHAIARRWCGGVWTKGTSKQASKQEGLMKCKMDVGLSCFACWRFSIDSSRHSECEPLAVSHCITTHLHQHPWIYCMHHTRTKPTLAT